jgi:hypothetical protein
MYLAKCFVFWIDSCRERNLKCKTVHEAVNKFGRELPLVQFKGKIVCDKPNNSIHSFKGLLYLDAHREPIMLSNANIMLRVRAFINYSRTIS